MSKAEMGDRVALVETVPGNTSIRRTRLGTVVDTGARGVEVRFDAAEGQRRRTSWIRDSEVHFVVSEGEGDGDPVVSKKRPEPQREEKPVASPQQQSSHYKQELPSPTLAKPPQDALSAFLAQGGDLLDLWEALGSRVGPEVEQRYHLAREAHRKAVQEHTEAEAEVRRAKESLALAEQIARDTQAAVEEAARVEEEALTRFKRVQGRLGL